MEHCIAIKIWFLSIWLTSKNIYAIMLIRKQETIIIYTVIYTMIIYIMTLHKILTWKKTVRMYFWSVLGNPWWGPTSGICRFSTAQVVHTSNLCIVQGSTVYQNIKGGFLDVVDSPQIWPPSIPILPVCVCCSIHPEV